MTATGKRPWSLSQLHLLLTGECKYECDHCFVWSGPEQGNTMNREIIGHILDQAEDLGTIEWIYFEGGEPFLFFELLLWGAQQAHQRGFRVGVVSNAYWAEDVEKAIEKLRPFAGLIEDLSISDDAYHGSGETPGSTTIARRAAEELGIPVAYISVSGPDSSDSPAMRPQLSAEDTTVCYRGRAAEKLAPLVRHQPWDRFTACPWEDLRQPERVHVDSMGNLHICQGLSIGNLLESSPEHRSWETTIRTPTRLSARCSTAARQHWSGSMHWIMSKTTPMPVISVTCRVVNCVENSRTS